MGRQQQALDAFQSAREYYLARRFDAARMMMQRYRQGINYIQFSRRDNRSESKPEISIIIVGYGTGVELIGCLESVLAQQGPRFEVILIDNGGNESIHTQLQHLPLCWVQPPINLLPGEGRNIGAYFARGEILVFLDDDAILAPGYLASVYHKSQTIEFLGLRGRVLPKSTDSTSKPGHYDLGGTEIPSEFNLEGNMVIRRSLLIALGGFDPLMFGHEGKYLTYEWNRRFPGHAILYSPDLVIYHDWAVKSDLANKRRRQSLGSDYLNYLKERALSDGLSIIVRAGDKIEDTRLFIEELVRNNTYKPIEILIWAIDSRKALSLIQRYMANFFLRVLPPETKTFGRVVSSCRYHNCMIVDMPVSINGGLLATWVLNKNINQESLMICSGDELQTLADLPFGTAISELITLLSKSGRMRILPEPATLAPPDNSRPRTKKEKPRIVGGMATIPERQGTLIEVLSVLAPQFDELHVYLNGHKEKPNLGLPENIVFHLDHSHGDLGAKGKFFGLNFARPDDYYFSLDDDFLYPSDYVSIMLNAMHRYQDMVAVCVHGSIFGSPLDWYFERTSTFSARQGLKSDRFVNLAGTGTFACSLAKFPIEFLDVMPRTMCDLQISIKARKLGVPMVAIKREKNWLRSIAVDSVISNEGDYWSKMLKNDEGRTEVAKKQAWDFVSCKGYIFDTIEKTLGFVSDTEKLREEGFDVDFINAVTRGGVPDAWNPEKSEIYYLRKFQYFSGLLNGGTLNLKREEILRAPAYKNFDELRSLAVGAKNKWAASPNG